MKDTSRLTQGRRTRAYTKWCSLRARCQNPSHPAWKYYGGRGITVDSRWLGPRGFDNFFADMGAAPDGKWIDRIDNSKGYGPGNCRWVTPRESAQNKRQRKGIPGSWADKARKAGLPYSVVIQRIRGGWNPEVALSRPVKTVLGPEPGFVRGEPRERGY